MTQFKAQPLAVIHQTLAIKQPTHTLKRQQSPHGRGTKISQGLLFLSGQKEPVFLHWSRQAEAYFSEELQVPCGDFTGHVIVEGTTFPAETFSVRSYTFEVDLFLKEGAYGFSALL